MTFHLLPGSRERREVGPGYKSSKRTPQWHAYFSKALFPNVRQPSRTAPDWGSSVQYLSLWEAFFHSASSSIQSHLLILSCSLCPFLGQHPLASVCELASSWYLLLHSPLHPKIYTMSFSAMAGIPEHIPSALQVKQEFLVVT